MASFVGREREFTTLRQALDRAAQGNGSLVLVSGEAGIGKTSLVQKVVEQAGQHDALILSGHCYDLSATPPYGPWIDLFRTYRPAGGLPAAPVFLPETDTTASPGSQEALYESTVNFFADLSTYHPLILVLEDLHWSDQASLDFLRYLARYVGRRRILLVVTYRDDEITRHQRLFQLLPALTRESDTTRIELKALDVPALTALVWERFKLADVESDALVNYLLRRADGNPLFTDELLRALEQERVLERSENGWNLGELSTTVVPSLIRQMVEGRMASLSDTAVNGLQGAAVIGQNVPLPLWEKVVGTESVATSFEESIASYLITHAHIGREMTFRHALVREAIYEGISITVREGIHQVVADALLELAEPDPDVVAYHLKQAGDARAGEWLLRAGERAEQSYAWVEAVQRYDAALSCLQRDAGETELRAGLLLKLGRLLRFANPDRSLEYLRDAHRVAVEREDLGISGHALFNIGLVRCNTGDIRRGIPAMTSAMDVLESSPEEAERPIRWAFSLVGTRDPRFNLNRPLEIYNGSLSIHLAFVGRYREAIERAERYINVDWRQAAFDECFADIAIGVGGNTEACHALGLSHVGSGEPDDADVALRLAYEIGRNTGQFGVCLVVGYSLLLHHFQFRATRLRERDRLAEEIKEWGRLSTGVLAAEGSWVEEQFLFHEGRWGELRRVIETAHLPPVKVMQEAPLIIRAKLKWFEGHVDEARQIMRQLLPDGPATEPGSQFHVNAIAAQRLAAEIAIDSGDLGLAHDWMEAHENWLEWNGSQIGRAEGLLLRARIFDAEGDSENARMLAAQALAHAKDPEQPLALLSIHRYLGDLATEGRDYRFAREHLERSVSIAAACRVPFELARSRLSLAELLFATGDLERASSLLADAKHVFVELGASPAFKMAGALAERITPALASNVRSHNLTPRELEVLRLLTQGLSDREIGEALFISHHTVMNHVSSILRKLDVESRTAAAAFAVRENLV